MAVKSALSIVSLKEKGHFEHEDDTRIDKYTLADELPAKLSELQLSPRAMTTSPGYTIRIITKDDQEEVLHFLRRFFFLDEPMNRSVQLLETPESRCKDLEAYVCSSLHENISVAAVDDSGDIVGIIINGIARRNDVHESTADTCPNPKFQRILRVLEHLEKEGHMWEHLPADCDAVVEVRIASTHDAWRGRGLMKVLCDETERLAKEIGAKAMRMDATSAFSAAAVEKLHYKCIYRVRFADLPFAPQPEAPHLEARVYIKEI